MAYVLHILLHTASNLLNKGTEIEITSHAATATVIDSLMNFWIQFVLHVSY